MSDESKSRGLDVVLKEFDTLRATMERRAGSLLTLLSVNATAAAAVAGFVLSNHADPRVLLVLPFLSAGLGLLAINQYHGIGTARAYIAHTLQPLIAEYTGDPRLLGSVNEEAASETKVGVFMVQALSWGLLFLLVPVFALAVTATRLRSGADWAAWVTGVVLVVAMVVAWFLLFAVHRVQGMRGR